MATGKQFFQSSYAPGQNAQFLADLRASLGKPEEYSTDWGDGKPAQQGYTPVNPTRYTPEQAAALYNAMDPRLFEDQETLLSLFYNGGEVPLQLTPEQIRRQSERFAENQEGSWFDKLAGAAALGVGALVTGGMAGLWGTGGIGAGAGGAAGAGAGSGGMTAAEAWGSGAGLGGDTLTAVGATEAGGGLSALAPASAGSFGGVTGVTAGEAAAGAAAEVGAGTAGAYTTAAADSALASQTLGLTAADVSAAAATGNLSAAQIAQLAKAGLTVATLVGGGQAISRKGGGGAGGGMGGDPASKMAEADWAEFNSSTRPRLNEQAETMGRRGDAAYDESLGVVRGSQKMADQMDADYNNTYRPFQKQQAEYVDRLGSQAYRDQKRGEAVADVQQQYDNTLGQNVRALERQGVNPNSGRALAMRNQGAIQAATSKVNASANAERGAYADWAKGLDTMNANGMALQKQALANRGEAMNWSKFGLGAGASGLSAGLDVDKAGTARLSATGGILNNAGSVNNGARQISNQQNQYDDSNDLGTAALGYGLKWLTSPKSDAVTNAGSLWSSLIN